MVDSLFGDLHQAYVSGNSINFRDIEHTKHAKEQQHHDDGKTFASILATSQITAFTTFPLEGLIAYSERQSTNIHIVKWPQLSSIGVNNGLLVAPPDLEIVSLAFAADGQYLASLGSLPNHTICVWDWRGNIQRAHNDTNPLLTSTPNLGPARQISFNPMDKRLICTSDPVLYPDTDPPLPTDSFDLDVAIGPQDGLCRGIRFWKILMGYKRWDLLPIKIMPHIHTMTGVSSHVKTQPSTTVPLPTAPLVALGHVWRADQSVVVATSQHILLLYSPLKNQCRTLPTKSQVQKPHQKFAEPVDSDQPSDPDLADPAAIAAAQLPVQSNDTVWEDRVVPAHCLIYSKDLIITGGGVDTTITYLKTDSQSPPHISRQFQLGVPLPPPHHSQSTIKSLAFSPRYDWILASLSDGRIIIASTQHQQQSLSDTPDTRTINPADAGDVTCIDASRMSEMCVTGSARPEILLWDTKTAGGLAVRRRVPCGAAAVTAIAACPYSGRVVAVGNADGYLRLLDLGVGDDDGGGGDGGGGVLLRERLFRTPIRKVLFDPTGRYLLAAAAASDKVFVIDVYGSFVTLGYLVYAGDLQSVAFNIEGGLEGGMDQSLDFYVLASTSTANCSFIHKFTVPGDKTLLVREPGSLQISKSSFQMVTYRVEGMLVDISPVPTHLSAGKELLYVLSLDRKLMLISGPSVTQHIQAAGSLTGSKNVVVSDTTLMSKPLFEARQHEKGGCLLRIGTSIDWICTWSLDGSFIVRSLLEHDKQLRVQAHDPVQAGGGGGSGGGIKDLCIGSAGRCIYTVGYDGSLKSWDWTFTGNGKKMAGEAVIELERVVESRADVVKKLEEVLGQRRDCGDGVVDDLPDREGDASLSDPADGVADLDAVDLEKVQFGDRLRAKISQVKEKVGTIIRQNEGLSALERIDKEEFVLDYKERDRLLAQADSRIDGVRRDIETSNLTKMIIQQRIKLECWDSMMVVGQSVKSFAPDPLTGNTIEVANYPLRVRPPAEIQLVEKVKLVREVEIIVARESNPKDRLVVDTDTTNDDDVCLMDSRAERGLDDEPGGLNALIYEPFELITTERRKMQALLFSEFIHESKLSFNKNFLKYVKAKREGISKIEEKNERIKAVIEELQIKEAIFHPELDDDEVPERIIEVLDSEVLSQKFVTLEDRRKLEDKRLHEEGRLQSQKHDNWAERALVQMMGGKLEDRCDQEEKVELFRPDWMNKPKEEMSDEERKLVKEFEKKQATFKEEQEKYKKALETELRKLQSAITEICDTFDRSLAEFFNVRIKNDQLIYQTELKLIKLNQTSVFGEHDELREQEILARLEHLKTEKIVYLAEIPEIKKELERCRDEYDQVLKRDKEVDRQFKKDFHTFDFYYDSLMKLFKRRELVPDTELVNSEVKQITNPYSKENDKVTTVWEDPPGLNIELDLPEGLSADLWNKLVELRDKKILLEQETFMAYNKFAEMQILVQAVLDESERIRTETDKLTADLNQFLDYKFHTTYNVESLFELKQGQVEIPQAPVVTDYSDAVLINRGCVERLNESIVGLGKGKVEALREIKEYRRGIHAHEWENKMLDFQAEDAIIRTRDIQLLRLTKQMQEYLRSGDEYAQTTEIVALEKRAEYSQKAHLHKLEEKERSLLKLRRKIRDKSVQNEKLDEQLVELVKQCEERTAIFQSSSKNVRETDIKTDGALLEIYNRRRLVDLAKAQAQDISILREEVERLRLRTYPAFSASIKRPSF